MCWTLVDISSDYWALRKIVQTESILQRVNLQRVWTWERQCRSTSACWFHVAWLIYEKPKESPCANYILRWNLNTPSDWPSTKAGFLCRTLSRSISQFCVSKKLFFFCISTYRIHGAVVHDIGTFHSMRLVRARSLRKLTAWDMYVGRLRLRA